MFLTNDHLLVQIGSQILAIGIYAAQYPATSGRQYSNNIIEYTYIYIYIYMNNGNGTFALPPVEARVVVQHQVVADGGEGLQARQLRIEHCLELEGVHRSAELT
jgi:hypothetical protein